MFKPVHFAGTVASRSNGKNAVAMAAYRSGAKLKDFETGETKNYSLKEGVIHSEIRGPENMPSAFYDRETLWNEVEKRENSHKRFASAQLANEFNMALPNDLSKEQQHDLVVGFVDDVFVSEGMIVDINFHEAAKYERVKINSEKGQAHLLASADQEVEIDGGYIKIPKPKNDHVHLQMTLRNVDEKGFGLKNRKWSKLGVIKDWRKSWTEHVNKAMEKANLQDRYFSGSYKDMRFKQIPTVHEGPRVRQLELLGVRTEIGNLNREIKEHNNNVTELAATQKEIRMLQEDKKRKDAEERKQNHITVDEQLEHRFHHFYASNSRYNRPTEWSKDGIKTRLANEMFEHKIQFYDLWQVSHKNGKLGDLIFKDDNGVRSILRVEENLLTAISMSNEDGARRIVDGALGQGWTSIKLTGNDEFYKLAAEKALDAGLEVLADGEKQQAILDKIIIERKQAHFASLDRPVDPQNGAQQVIAPEPTETIENEEQTTHEEHESLIKQANTVRKKMNKVGERWDLADRAIEKRRELKANFKEKAKDTDKKVDNAQRLNEKLQTLNDEIASFSNIVEQSSAEFKDLSKKHDGLLEKIKASAEALKKLNESVSDMTLKAGNM